MPLQVTVSNTPAAAAPQAAPAAPATPAQVVDLQASAASGASPTAVLEGAKAQRQELRNQQSRLEDKRQDISRELADENTPNAAKPGLEARLKDVDAQIAATDQALAQADQAVARASAVPGAVVKEPPVQRNGPPEEVFIIPVVFTIFVLAPIAIAYARRIWKRGATVIAPIPREVTDRLEQLGQSVESIALEVERIGEGQRFVTKVMTESGRALGAGAAQPIAVPHGERVGVPRQG